MEGTMDYERIFFLASEPVFLLCFHSYFFFNSTAIWFSLNAQQFRLAIVEVFTTCFFFHSIQIVPGSLSDAVATLRFKGFEVL
jgi:hypothetical protein